MGRLTLWIILCKGIDPPPYNPEEIELEDLNPGGEYGIGAPLSPRRIQQLVAAQNN